MVGIPWYLCISTWLCLYQVSIATPVENKLWKALETQDKICSMRYAENEGSYKHMFESLSGLRIPAALKEYDKKSYTGFKLLRTYNVELFNLAIKSTIDVVFCREGKIQWNLKQPLEDDVDWTTPLCVYTPDVSGEWNTSSDKKRTPKERALEDLKNFHCFKLARRKKYTNRKASLFFPGSWVGGMFYCDLDDEMKTRALKDMHGNLRFKRSKGHDLCDRGNSIPLVPMQSDDYSKNWIEFSGVGTNKFPTKVFKPQITKYVPYINTPNDAFSRLNFENKDNVSIASATALSWRKPFREQALAIFDKNKIYSTGKDPWFSEIDVDENYQISSNDISAWQSWTDHAVAKLSSATNKPSKSFMSSRLNASDSHTNSKGFLKGLLKKIESKIWNRLQLRDKVLSILGDDPKSLENLQTEWKNLQMDPERFDYSYE